MADNNSNHKVKVTFEADTKKLREAMSQVSKDAKKVHTQNSKFNREDAKQTTNLNNNNKKQTRETRQNRQREFREAREARRNLQQQNKDLKEQLRIYNQLRKAQRQLNRERGRGGGGGGGDDGPDPKPKPRRGGRAGFLRSAASSALLGLGGLAFSGIAGLLSMPFGGISDRYQAARSYGMNLSSLAGFAGGGIPKSRVDSLRKGYGQNLGYSAQETIAAQLATSKATGNYVGGGSALAFGRLLGEDPSAVASMFGVLRQGGVKEFGMAGGKGRDEVIKAIAAGMTTGLENARLPEFLDGVMSLTQRASSREGGDVSSTNFSRLLAILGSTRVSGLQGARGVQVASALEEGFTSPGAGEEGMAIGLSAMGFGRSGPGGNRSYYEAKRAMQQGTAGDPNFIKTMIDQVNAVYGGGEEANLAIEQMMGGRLSLSQIEEVQKAMASGSKPENLREMLRDMTISERDVLVQIRDLLAGNDEMLRTARRSVEIENENIDQGEQMTESLERTQDEFRKFIAEMMPAVLDVLKTLADFITEMRPVLKDIALSANYLAAHFSGKKTANQVTLERAQAETNKANKSAKKLQDVVTNGAPLTPEQETQILNTANQLATANFERHRAIRNMSSFEGAGMFGDNPAANARFGDARGFMNLFSSRPTEMINGQETVVPDQYSDTATRETYNLRKSSEQFVQMYDRLARNRGFTAAEGATDTPAEIRAMLTFLVNNNVSLPESIRAYVNNTGGAQ